MASPIISAYAAHARDLADRLRKSVAEKRKRFPGYIAWDEIEAACGHLELAADHLEAERKE